MVLNESPPSSDHHRGDHARVAHSSAAHKGARCHRARLSNRRHDPRHDDQDATEGGPGRRTANEPGFPKLLILKGGFEPHSRVLCHMHEREVRGYRDVLPIVKLPSPACYFADYDPERQQGIIIMDDLVARGVTFCHATQAADARADRTPPHCARTVSCEDLGQCRDRSRRPMGRPRRLLRRHARFLRSESRA